MGERIVLKWAMPSSLVEFQMPEDAVVIHVRGQGNIPTLWTLSSEGSPHVTRTFVGYGTGHPISEDGDSYVGSVHDIDGWMVFHIFERPRVDG